MINIENVEVVGWESAIRGMRNPMNSWDKSDSEFNVSCRVCKSEHYRNKCDNCLYSDGNSLLGNNDLALMKKLVSAGTDHSKFMRMINVTVDITAPLYWWKEFDTYKVGTVRNSCSTMHKVTEKEFTLDDFSCEHLKNYEGFKENGKNVAYFLKDFEYTVKALNTARKLYLQTGDKQYWWQIIQLLPSSYNQKATLMLNYAVLRNMYHSRKNHHLDEWRDFCRWVESLPYSEQLITGGNADEMQP